MVLKDSFGFSSFQVFFFFSIVLGVYDETCFFIFIILYDSFYFVLFFYFYYFMIIYRYFLFSFFNVGNYVHVYIFWYYIIYFSFFHSHFYLRHERKCEQCYIYFWPITKLDSKWIYESVHFISVIYLRGKELLVTGIGEWN